MSNELNFAHARLAEKRITIETLRYVDAFDGQTATLAHVYEPSQRNLACQSLVVVGARAGNDELLRALKDKPDDLVKAGIKSVDAVGDAHAPGSIVHAVYFGRKYAETLDRPDQELYRIDAPIQPAELNPEPIRLRAV